MQSLYDIPTLEGLAAKIEKDNRTDNKKDQPVVFDKDGIYSVGGEIYYVDNGKVYICTNTHTMPSPIGTIGTICGPAIIDTDHTGKYKGWD